MELSIRHITQAEEQAFDKLSLECGSVFARMHWIRLIPKAIVLGFYQKDGQLVGGCVLEQQKLGPFTILTNPVFAANCGLFLKSRAESKSGNVAWFKAAGLALGEFLNQRKEALIDISFPPEFIDVQALHWKGFKTMPAYTFRLDLQLPEADLIAGMDAKRRNRIRKLAEEGIRTELSSDTNALIELVRSRLAEKKVGVNGNRLEAIIRSAQQEGWGYGLLSRSDEGIIAAAYCVHDEHTAYYLFGGIKSGNAAEGGASLALWSALLQAKERKMKQFDFEGSMNPQIEHFFRGFGGQITPYYRIKKASLWMEGLLRLFRPGIWH